MLYFPTFYGQSFVDFDVEQAEMLTGKTFKDSHAVLGEAVPVELLCHTSSMYKF